MNCVSERPHEFGQLVEPVAGAQEDVIRDLYRGGSEIVNWRVGTW